MESICGINCANCKLSGDCQGCLTTNGRPFGEDCIVAACCQRGETALNEWKERLIAVLNGLGIEDMEEVTELKALKGSFVNLEYRLPNNQKVKLWDDHKIYLGNQICKINSERCYGIVADEKYLMVSEYGECGANAEIVIFARWN